MTDDLRLDDSDSAAINQLFVGRRIVDALGDTLFLDDGTHVAIRGNDGCWSCSSGNYSVEHVRSHDHIITSATVVEDPTARQSTYRLFVYTDHISTEVATVEGDDGNGYYGSGFTIHVHLPKKV